MDFRFCLVALITSTAQTLAAPPNDPDDLFVRVIDVGGGHASVIRIPAQGNSFEYVIYDTGHWNTDNLVLEEVQAIIPEGEEIDLAFAQAPMSVYQGEVSISFRLEAAEGAGEGARLARLRLRYQACDDRKCLAPAELPLVLVLQGPSVEK